MPEGVRLVIGRRVKRLTEDARRVLTSAAVAGRSFDERLLEALGDAEGDALLSALEEAEAAKLIVPQPSRRQVRWEFAHGLIRQTLEGSLSLMRRQRAHLRVAEALEQVHGTNVERHASDVAQHLYQAGAAASPEKTVRFLTLSGDQAFEAAAFDEALRRFSDALSIQEEHDPDDQRIVADLHFQRAQAIAGVGRWEEAVAEWLVALEGFKALTDHAAIALTAVRSWYTRAWNGRGEEGLDDVDGALAAMTVDGPERCRLLGVAGLARGFSGLRGGDERISEAEAMAAELGDVGLVAAIAHDRTWYNQQFMLTRAGLESGRRAEAFYETSNMPWELADVRGSMHFMESYRGEFAELNREAPELEKLGDQTGHVGTACGARLFPAWIALLAHGDLKEGSNALQEEVDRERRLDYGSRYIAVLSLATALEWSGKWDEALPCYKEAAALEGQNMYTHTFASALLLARVLHGDAEAAAEMLSMEPLARAGEDNLVGEWEQLLNVVEGRAFLGESAAVAPLLEDRQRRSVERRLKAARLGRFKPIADWDWDWPTALDRLTLERLLALDFLPHADNVILVGAQGLGKTMLAKNLVHEAVLAGHSGRFLTASDLLLDLNGQETARGLERRLRHYARPSLLAIDEIGYLAYDAHAADLLFQIVSRRYEHRPLVITTNLPFKHWDTIFPNASCAVALIDRLTHHAEILAIEGESYRKREAELSQKQRKATRKPR